MLIMLTVGKRGSQPDASQRGSLSCPAPRVRLAYASHVHPNLTFPICLILIPKLPSFLAVAKTGVHPGSGTTEAVPF
jgi:hypothetical protein